MLSRTYENTSKKEVYLKKITNDFTVRDKGETFPVSFYTAYAYIKGLMDFNININKRLGYDCWSYRELPSEEEYVNYMQGICCDTNIHAEEILKEGFDISKGICQNNIAMRGLYSYTQPREAELACETLKNRQQLVNTYSGEYLPHGYKDLKFIKREEI